VFDQPEFRGLPRMTASREGLHCLPDLEILELPESPDVEERGRHSAMVTCS
jgi:hypothetical protein